ncbi:PPR domain-containing protein/DYW_deaminase domain-containing protein [Cephalotus follicularis]|uniref:PPR domain-containing protein/DYW_deaminase domain-containing protein n=1 Tax=Cephalotus follicularis TaxID=3775 RepID=A0A1Q3CQS2_CEPFO|nr:PPR domain-containing protein/DYW_deaminase domain-containing protein [Cephalotus follicularis]
MLCRGVGPDKHTFPRVLSASRHAGDLPFGQQLHGHALKLGLSSDKYVISALIELYGLLDSVDSAKLIFDKSPSHARNSVTWTMLARLYLTKDKPNVAIHLFNQMVEDLNGSMDPVALATAITACTMLKSLKEGKRLHMIARKCGLEFDVLVSNSLLKMYIDCSSIDIAREIFDQMPSKDIISWTEIIRGYVKKGGFNESLKLFREKIRDGKKPDSLSLSSILPACARMAAHKHGKEIHGYLLRNGVDFNLTVQNAIMDMYVKSGFIESAAEIFGQMKKRDVISWTMMILGHSLHGQGELGVNLFCKMDKDSSIEIDQSMYLAVLHACCTARRVEEGRYYFNCIRTPKVTHCALMVALLARAGRFDEAKIFIEERKSEREAEVLRALLDGCRIHRQVKIGKQVIEQLCNLEPLNAENYVLLSNWHADHAKWQMAENLRETIRDMGLKPKKAYSWIEFQNKVHVFGTGDVSHPRSERIYWELQCLMKKIEDEGHKPNSDFFLHDVNEERECIQIGHSEMLALSFGLISTQSAEKIRITKNHRVCFSCHDSAKKISKLVQREIIIRDLNRFHHFKNGLCSCGDFW